MVDLGGLDYFLNTIDSFGASCDSWCRSFSLPLRRIVVIIVVVVGKVVDDAIRRVVVAVLVRVVVTVGRSDQSLHPSLLLPPGGWILW